ncbi:hypothetical protein M408DRAFT_24645 [Serendipita vermifera MAFF 305830]|uniref:JmjC domain-containing protein n=1 Tax=Serendipita vermifera MAFF 305830 TaxID=933852 RepID=A0A0C3B7I5_SERVB|nr:hypothetical protein M408DRAFT_24645 [Serendipita vermifera MAFF 305830]
MQELLFIDYTRPVQELDMFPRRSVDQGAMFDSFCHYWKQYPCPFTFNDVKTIKIGTIECASMSFCAWYIKTSFAGTIRIPHSLEVVPAGGDDPFVLDMFARNRIEQLLLRLEILPDPQTRDWDYNVDVWTEPTPVNLDAYAEVGLRIANRANLVPVGHSLKRPYWIFGDARQSFAEIPIFLVGDFKPATILRHQRYTRGLSHEYGGYALRLENYAGTDHVDTLLRYFNTPAIRDHLDLDKPKQKRLYPRREPHEFQYMVVQGRINDAYTMKKYDEAKTKDPNFLLSSVWAATSPMGKGKKYKTDPLLKKLPLLSEQVQAYVEDIPRRPTELGETEYIAGVGVNSQNQSILDAIQHPQRNALRSLPPILIFAGALYWYSAVCARNSDPDECLAEAYSTALEDAPGTLTSWSYLGTGGSFFGLHQEDVLLPSANQHIAGAPKVWINVPARSLERLMGVVSGRIDPCFMLHRKTFFHPRFFLEHHIPVNVLVQQPGDLFLPDAHAAHEGWNTGANMAEAVNYADMAAIRHIEETLMVDSSKKDVRCAWPCVCGEYPLPGKKATQAKGQKSHFYDPTKDKKPDLSCTPFYNSILALIRNIRREPKGHPDLLDPSTVLKIHEYVYSRLPNE